MENISNEKTRLLIEELLAILDPDEKPEVYSYLQSLACAEDDEIDSPMDIADNLHGMKPLPQPVWDVVIELLELETEEGNCVAMNNLGALYYDGTGCEQSYEKAVFYYTMAAENGSRQAQENLGYCYYYGRNVPVDYEKAFHYFALGAFDGHLISLYKIGDMYANGYYVPKNEREAFLIYERCMDTMTDEAAPAVAGPVLLRLGNAYLYGRGTKTSPGNAMLCFQKAEMYLYNMVVDGDNKYRKSLQAAIDGQSKARALLTAALNVFPYDNL